jgi:tight adherence protein B
MAMIVVVVCAIGVGLGTSGFVVALRDHPTRSTVTAFSGVLHVLPGPRGDGGALSHRETRAWSLTTGLALVSGLVVGLLTRWPVAGILAAIAVVGLPRLLRSTTPRDATRRTEAVAVWTELLRDTLTASAGLAQAIVATAEVAPADIRVPATHLADRIMSGVSMDDALRQFATDLHDPSADDVIAALRLAATSRAQRLVDLLTALADSTREEVTMRLRVESSRASARSGVRTVIGFSLGFVALLTVAAQTYLAPFRTFTGQLVLVVVGAFYAIGLVLMVRLVRPTTDLPLSGPGGQ